MERWSGRPALVTGASAGIGAGVVRALVKHGMRVAACARDLKRLQALKAELKDSPGTVLPIQCDLRKEDDIMAMFATIKKEFGGVDVCVNSAGLGYDCPLLTGSTENWREMLDVNVLALCICTREAVQTMRDRNVDDGHVFHLSSMSGHRLTDKTEHFYAGNKNAVRVMTEGLRRELRETNSHIRVTAISPGNVTTEFVHRMYAHDKEEQAKQTKLTIENLEVEDIVGLLMYTLGTHPRVQVHDILVRPTEQFF